MDELFERLGCIVGKDSVITDEETLKDYVSSYTGFDTYCMPFAMVYATNAEQVQEIVKLANKLKFRIVVCSSRNPEKLTGSSLPSGENTLVLNLSRMNKIIRIDQRNRIACIEAGVTFEQLNGALSGLGLEVDHPFLERGSKSVVASLFDRTPTTVPMNVWDVNDPLLCLEVVFGDGIVFRTGSAAGPGTMEEMWEAGVAMNNSMGPSHLDFSRALSGSQGTLGIVTWATVKLEYCATVEQPMYIQANQASGMAPATAEAIRRRIGNHYMLLNNFAAACAIGKTPEEIDRLADQFAPWTMITTIVGKRRLPQEKVAYQMADYREIALNHRLDVAESLSVTVNSDMIPILTGLNEGQLWKHRYTGNCLDLFFLTTMDQIDTFVQVMRDAMAASGAADMKLGVYAQPSMQGRYCQLEFLVGYQPDQSAQARCLYDLAVDKLLSAGAFFSRPHGSLTEKVFEKAETHRRSLEKLKDLFDPNRVLNPGKLSYQEVN